MINKTRRSRGFTLIELLVVVLILGILLAIAIPAYLSSVKDSKGKTASSNARAIATAVQAAYVKGGGTSYAGFDAASMDGNATLKSDLGGGVPLNPCLAAPAGTFAGDYTINAAAGQWDITPKTDAGACTSLVTTTLKQ